MPYTVKKLRHLWAELAVEPVGTAAFLGLITYILVSSVGLLDILCHQHFKNDPRVDCASRDYHNASNEELVQRASSDWSTYLSVAYLVPASAAGLLLGAWGDRIGRKFNIIAGLGGTVVALMGFLILLADKDLSLGILLVGGALGGSTGFIGLVPVSCFAYISDTNCGDKTKLTIRMFYFQLAINLGGALGGFLGGQLPKFIGLDGAVTFGMSALVAGIVWALVRVPQTPPLVMKQRARERERDFLTSVGREIPSALQPAKDPVRDVRNIVAKETVGPKRGIVKEVMRLQLESVRTYVRPRADFRRAFICLCALVYFVNTIVNIGLRSASGLYLQKTPFSWSASLYGTYIGLGSVLGFLGSGIAIFVLKKWLGLSDPLIAAISSMAQTAQFLINGLATQTWHIFLAEAIGSISYIAGPCIKSFVTQLVAPDEVGKVFTAFGLALDLGIVIGTILFNTIYRVTLDSFAGTFFVVAAGMTGTCCGAMLWVTWASRDLRQRLRSDTLIPDDEDVKSIFNTRL